MKVFLTGATGYIGSVIAEKLLQAGHQVVGLARSEAAAQTLKQQGIEPYYGDLNNPETLTVAAQAVDGVIHTAFDMSTGDFSAANAAEARAVEALISGLKGSNKPLILTSGTGVLGNTGELIYEEEMPITPAKSPAVKALQMRLSIEQAVLEATSLRGVVLRPPNVYGRSDGRVVFWMLRAAAQKLGAVPYASGAGQNQWTFVHVDDLADLFVLALEKAPGGELFHAGAQSGLRTQDLAAALSRGMGLNGKTVELEKAELTDAIGFAAMADYWSSNSQSSGEKARRVLGWQPQHLDLLNEVGRPSA
ncbi:NAD-dependent epimerase/dehydratase family protein [Hymenobacter volaticus]|uniref:NAD-dependent epimerase/dehydratase family protein n=1 Tax=Hymenobacter volaticus TaxID=2932254 RepID=A0ABY4GEB2_9BACT|nr:NAD-dependent epimerase/dehydratase family protein [Hymenobacter volaticus]UOQ69268.1 NAD-dependent epimerase/dehydratase family protein [Hymenobacter volaticus]